MICVLNWWHWQHACHLQPHASWTTTGTSGCWGPPSWKAAWKERSRGSGGHEAEWEPAGNSQCKGGQWHPGLYWEKGMAWAVTSLSPLLSTSVASPAVLCSVLGSSVQERCKQTEGSSATRMKEWRISSMRKDWKSWDCSAGRKEGSEGSHQCLQIGKLKRGWSQAF